MQGSGELATLVIVDDAFTRTSISGALTNAGLKVVAAAGDARECDLCLHDA